MSSFTVKSDPSHSKILTERDRERLADVATANQELAKFFGQGKYEDASKAGQRASEITRLVFGDKHPSYAKSLGNLAATYHGAGDFSRAEALYSQALRLTEPTLGRHPEYAASLTNLAELFVGTGKFAEAEPYFLRALNINKRVLGDRHADYATSLNGLGGLYHRLGKHDQAATYYERARKIWQQALGEEHPNYATSLNNLAAVYSAMGDYGRAEHRYQEVVALRKQILGEDHPNYAASLHNLATYYTNVGDYETAETHYLEANEIWKTTLGESHPNYATSLRSIALLYKTVGDYVKAEPMMLKTCDIVKTVLGDKHPAYASSLEGLASLYDVMGRPVQALELYQTVRRHRLDSLGERHPDSLKTLVNLADVYVSQGDYSRAAPLYREACDLRQKTLGEEHPDYAVSLNKLGVLHLRMGDQVRAESLFIEAGEIHKGVFGEEHPRYAADLNNLAVLYTDMGEYAAAERLAKQAIGICKSIFGENHQDYAATLNALAAVYSKQGDFEREKTLRETICRILTQTLGTEHPNYAASLVNLASLHYKTGDFTQAEELHRQASTILARVLGEQHPKYARALNNLATVYDAMGNHARAEPLRRQALDIQKIQIGHNAIVQSARQQYRNQQLARVYLDHRISNALVSESFDAATIAADIWHWKGAVTERQSAYRAAAKEPALAPAFEKLRSVTQQLSVALTKAPLPPETPASETRLSGYEFRREIWRRRLTRLTKERETLEQQIASASPILRRALLTATPESVRSALGDHVALVDFLEYTHSRSCLSDEAADPDADRRRYVAIVVRGKGPIRLVELGAAKRIQSAIIDFRRELTATAEDRDSVLPSAGARLRQSLWAPIEPILEGIDTVLFSPDTELGTLPFAALPGRASDRFLIEDYRLVSVPFANLLQNTQQESATDAPRLLVLGSVDYDHSEPKPKGGTDPIPQLAFADDTLSWTRSPGDQNVRWETLPGFQSELDAVTQLFQKRFGSASAMKTLSGSVASETAFLREASRHSHLHLITHGFFAPPTVRSIDQTMTADGSSALGPDPFFETWIPSLLSGLVLSGANQTTSESATLDDGILRASEIEASSLQGVELVVLSACETGLGPVAGGEGLTGLQRAFHIAGARNVIASLWKVDDRATQELMRRFYSNLWIKRQSKVDALRNAQLWMLRHPAELQAMGIQTATRGPVREQRKPTEQNPRTNKATSPFLWAAFQLSGGWQ